MYYIYDSDEGKSQAISIHAIADLVFYYEWTKVYYICDSDEGKSQAISIQCQRACSVRFPWCLSFGLEMVACTI